jgi:hypothetical protein
VQYRHTPPLGIRLRQYMVMGLNADGGKKPIPPLNKSSKEGRERVYSWLGFFYTRDVYILGFTFDVAEYHLWWILADWARRRKRKEYRLTN